MDKFGRSYSLSVQASNGSTITIEPPFTLEFDVTRNTLSSANTSSFRLYNLSEKTRNLLRKNRWDYDSLRLISLRAGYEENLPFIFLGNISQAWSVREGTNFITTIQSFDGGFAYANAKTNTAYPSSTDLKSVITDFVSSLKDFAVSPGAIGDFAGAISRGNSYSGATTDLLREISGGAFFIDNGKANVLKDDECLDLPAFVITSKSGLLGTPILEETYINFDMLFEPNLSIGRRIKLESITGANFNGYYKVISLHHRGTISDAVCGEAITSVGLFAPAVLEGVPQYGPPNLTVVG